MEEFTEFVFAVMMENSDEVVYCVYENKEEAEKYIKRNFSKGEAWVEEIPIVRNRDEVHNLKQEIVDLQDQLKVRDSRVKSWERKFNKSEKILKVYQQHYKFPGR